MRDDRSSPQRVVLPSTRSLLEPGHCWHRETPVEKTVSRDFSPNDIAHKAVDRMSETAPASSGAPVHDVQCCGSHFQLHAPNIFIGGRDPVEAPCGQTRSFEHEGALDAHEQDGGLDSLVGQQVGDRSTRAFVDVDVVVEDGVADLDFPAEELADVVPSFEKATSIVGPSCLCPYA